MPNEFKKTEEFQDLPLFEYLNDQKAISEQVPYVIEILRNAYKIRRNNTAIIFTLNENKPIYNMITNIIKKFKPKINVKHINNIHIKLDAQGKIVKYEIRKSSGKPLTKITLRPETKNEIENFLHGIKQTFDEQEVKSKTIKPKTEKVAAPLSDFSKSIFEINQPDQKQLLEKFENNLNTKLS